MRKGLTQTGFSYEYDETRLDDMRIVDMLSTVMDEGAQEFARLSATSKLISILLGGETKARLYDHIGKSHEGRVPYAALEAELNDIMLGSTEIKN